MSIVYSVLIQVDQVDYSQLVTHGDGVSVTVRLLSNLHYAQDVCVVLSAEQQVQVVFNHFIIEL